jgi:hypothetical protein
MRRKVLIFTLNILVYLVILSLIAIHTYDVTKNNSYDEVLEVYDNHFQDIMLDFDIFFGELKNDITYLSILDVVKNKDDENFTSFLNANEESFEYNYSKEEIDIIEVFSKYKDSHDYINSVYMGRKNGSFVRSHPRTKATMYDPRNRPWYLKGMIGKGTPVLTDAYSSVTNNDINIGTVISLIDESGKMYGVVGMDVTINVLSERLSRRYLYLDGIISLVDKSGKIIISSDNGRVNTEFEEKKLTEIYKNATSVLYKCEDFYFMTTESKIPEGMLVACIPKENVDNLIKEKTVNSVLMASIVLIFFYISNLFIIFFVEKRNSY